MNDSASGMGVVLVLTAIFLGLLLAGGVGAYFWQRQQVSVRQLVHEQQAAKAAAKRLAALRANTQRAVESKAAERVNEAEAVRAAVRQVLETQQQAWNNGDVERFMESYWPSDDLTFSSGGTVTRSWQSVLDRYKTRYSSRREMGQLSFENLEIHPLGKQAAFVLGDWSIQRESETMGGNFTLVFRQLEGKWRIVHDHTSRSEQP